jgi:sulfide:quinone oxidoreductase
MRRVSERFGPQGLQVVYVGPFETPESCREWKEEHDLPFPVVPDGDGTLFRRLTSGWVPWSLLVSSDGEVLFSENEFDEEGFSTAIAKAFAEPREPGPAPATASPAAAPRRPGTGARIVILGAGVGGLVAARALRKRLGAEHRIAVVDRSSDHLFAPSLLWLMVGERREEQIRRPLDGLARKGIEFVHGEVSHIDLGRRLVQTTGGPLDFDYLIVALGAQTAPGAVEGFAEMAHDLYSLDGCRDIWSALQRFTGGRVGVLVTSMPFKCPAAPYEAALLVEAFLRERGVRDRSEIHLYTPEHQPMPVAEAALGRAVVGLLKSRGVHYHPLFTFDQLRPQTREIVAADGRAEPVDLLIAVPPHQAPEVVRSSGLLGLSGWIHVDPHTLRTEHERVFAIGDVTSIRLPSGKSLPKAGVFAHGEAEVVARQIADELRGRESQASFDGRGYCWIETGDGRAGFAGGSFYADPEPRVRIARPGRLWHWGKVAFEKWWLARWF